MLLAIDVGNSNTVLGAFVGTELRHQWRISTGVRTADEVGLLLLQLLAHAGVPPIDISGVVVGTVVPPVVRALRSAVARYLGCPFVVVDPTRYPDLPIRLPDPAAIGPDRLINLVAARERHQGALLVVDFGTATTFDAMDAAGAFVGGAIAPGLNIAAEALHSRTSRLPLVEPERPPQAIGTNTKDAMRSGLYFGYVGLVDGLARRIKAELGGAVCVATGGIAALVAADCVEIDHVDPDLTLHGLRLCFEKERP